MSPSPESPVLPRRPRARGLVRAALAHTALALVALGAAGCKSCHNDHPYVPYTVEDAPSSAAPSSALGADAGDAGLAERAATPAPPGLARWSFEGLALAAPEGQKLVSALAADFDEDGKLDAVALVRRDAPEDPGQAVYFHGTAPGAVDAPAVLGAPPALAADPSCTPVARLGQVGKAAALVELGFTCPGKESTAARRWLAVYSLARAPRALFAAALSDPPGAPALAIEAETADIDKDGASDLALRFTVSGGAPPFEPGPKVTASLQWLDRPAGMSRDPDEPDASLRAFAGTLMARATKGKEAAAIALAVAQMRSVYTAICPEGGAPRLSQVTGVSGIQCGPSRGLEEGGLAEARAHAAAGDVFRAVASLERAQRAPATKTTARETAASAWIVQAAPVLVATGLRAFAAVPLLEKSRAPSWGSLAFEPDGTLLVRTQAGVVRVDPVSADETTAEGVEAWKPGVTGSDGQYRWIEAYNPCTGPALRLTFAPMADGDLKDIAMPIAAPLGARCKVAKGEPVPAIPIAWGPRGLEALVAGEPILVAPDLARATLLAAMLDQAGGRGGPRSPSGKAMVLPTPLGLLVRAGKSRLYRAKELDGAYGELRDCTVSDDATRVACVRAGRVYVATFAP